MAFGTMGSSPKLLTARFYVTDRIPFGTQHNRQPRGSAKHQRARSHFAYLVGYVPFSGAPATGRFLPGGFGEDDAGLLVDRALGKRREIPRIMDARP